MKNILCCLFVISPLMAYAGASTPGCPKDSDACAAAPAARSPFQEASAAPAKASTAAQPVKAVKKTASQPIVTEIAAVSSSTAPIVSSAPPAPVAASNPLWIIFAAGGLAGLYLYLGKDSAKRKRK